MTYADTSHAERLAASWNTLGVLLAALVRGVLALERRRAPDAYAKAAHLQIWVRAALVLLMRDVSSLDEEDPAQTAEEAFAREYLAISRTLLLGLILVLARIMYRLLQSGLPAAPNVRTRIVFQIVGNPVSAPACAPIYLDPG